MGAGGGWAALAQGVTDIGKTVAAGVASKIQWKRTKRMMKNRHQWEVDDLRAAGLNPILSATKGPPSMGSPALMQIPAGGSVTAAYRAGKLWEAELDLLRAQATATRAGAGKATAETRNILSDPKRALFRTLVEPMLNTAQRKEIFKRLELSVEDIKARPGARDLWNEMQERWKTMPKGSAFKP